MNGQRTWICSGRKFSRAAARPVKVLVVDDDSDSADVAVIYLALMGIEARANKSSRETLAEFRLFAPDVVLLDINMPDLNGFDVARWLRGSTPAQNTVIVAYTSEAWEEIEACAVDAGFDGYFQKASEPALLVRFLKGYEKAGSVDER
ncbi:response regulator [Burkholderia glumae]|uniref:response regulator n=1 Tax=Burkholderia glumae TaxID=337 RepID=UPI0012967BCD|nr:response regulator [Burkholderia glumae]MCM2496156.1 response regulator [Burkholderia glumae]MCR1771090.1 response regulator [Burkholderia glumae]NVE26372.1 response regulator [Burkholderia glumae]QGA41722.1 response regulator [Burkholderia glumae]QHP94764.1 response regulator [Burkholderia glumae]